jgi:16S rRNA (guanine966-N2)-methyltransferase
MKLRIIAGTLRGRIITLSDKSARFRPTKDRVRQSLAETIKQRLPGSAVADLCAGSGAFGIECLSRGAARTQFVEHDRVLAEGISKHIERFGLTSRSSVFMMDVKRFITLCKDAFDIIFFDPPYADGELAELAPGILGLLTPEGLLLHERASGKEDAEHSEIIVGGARFFCECRRYGDTSVDFYSRRTA